MFCLRRMPLVQGKNPSYVEIFQFSVNEHFHYSRWKFKTTKNIGPDKFATLFHPSYVKIASVLTENFPEILLMLLCFFHIRRIKIRLIWKSFLSRTRLKQKSSVKLENHCHNFITNYQKWSELTKNIYYYFR